MKMKNIRACALCMAALAGMSVGTTAFASDITGHWAEENLQRFIDAGYMSGYEDGSYKPNHTITEA